MDGRNTVVKKDEFRVGDTVVLKLPEQKINEVLKMEKGNHAIIYQGKNRGKKGIIDDVTDSQIMIKSEGEVIITRKDY